MTTHKLSSLYSESNYSVVLINSKKGLTHKLMRNQESIRKVGEVIQARYLITGQLYNNSKVKAQILVDQFKSVFTTSQDKSVSETAYQAKKQIPPLHVTTKGIEKLLSTLNTTKATQTISQISSSRPAPNNLPRH